MKSDMQKEKGRSRWHGRDLSGKKNNFHKQYTTGIMKSQEIRFIKIKIAECEQGQAGGHAIGKDTSDD